MSATYTCLGIVMKRLRLILEDLKIDRLEDTLFAKFKDQSNIRWINPNLLLDMACNPPVPITEIEYQVLWNDMLSNGMETPLIVTVNEEKTKARLDSGNHRLQLFLQHGVTICPIEIRVVPNQVRSIGNGAHIGIDFEDFDHRLALSQ